MSKVATRIAKLLRTQLPAEYLNIQHDDCDYELLDAIESMEDCTVSMLATDLEAGIEAVDLLNEWLEVIYDWADANRVWMG